MATRRLPLLSPFWNEKGEPNYEAIKHHHEWLATRPMNEAFGLLMAMHQDIAEDYGNQEYWSEWSDE